MSLTSLINRPCTIIYRNPSGSEDDYGNDIPDEVAVETVCDIQQLSRAEPGGQGELSVTQWWGFFLPGTVLNTDDAVIADGLGEFEVAGRPDPTRNNRTRVDGQVEVTLRETKGAESGS